MTQLFSLYGRVELLGAQQVAQALQGVGGGAHAAAAAFNSLYGAMRGVSDMAQRVQNLSAGGLGRWLGESFTPGAGGFVGEAVGAFAKLESSLVRVRALLEATGYRAGYTSAQLKEMAEQMSRATGFKVPEVLEAQGNLLRSGEARGSVFQQAMEKAKALTISTGVSLPQAASDINKALRDPEYANLLFRRAGVTPFTGVELQRAKMLERQYGIQPGAAEQLQGMVLNKLPSVGDEAFNTLASSVHKVSAAFNELFAKIGQGMAPVVERFLEILKGYQPLFIAVGDFLRTKLIGFLDYLDKNKEHLASFTFTLVQTFIDLIEIIAKGVITLGVFFDKIHAFVGDKAQGGEWIWEERQRKRAHGNATAMQMFMEKDIKEQEEFIKRKEDRIRRGVANDIEKDDLAQAKIRLVTMQRLLREANMQIAVAGREKALAAAAPGLPRAVLHPPTFGFLSFEQSWRQVAQQLMQQSQQNMDKRKVELLQQAVGLLGQIAAGNPLGAPGRQLAGKQLQMQIAAAALPGAFVGPLP